MYSLRRAADVLLRRCSILIQVVRPTVRRDIALPNSPVISIIDDDASIRGATTRLVRLSGFTALPFASAEEFLQSPFLNETSCLITDVKMSGMSGLDLRRYLLDHGHLLPIIFITAFPEEVRRANMPETSTTCVLAKPFDGQLLIHCLSEALDDHGAGAA